METKRIKCPKCGTVMDVVNSKHEYVKHIKCPRCSSPLSVNFELTELLRKPAGARELPELEYKGKRYKLEEGENIVGRKAVASSATVQFATDDKTMSREHVIIKVTKLSNGRYKSVVRVCKAKNQTLIGCEELGGTDCIVLHDGDRIQMGMSVVTFKEPYTDDADMTVNM